MNYVPNAILAGFGLVTLFAAACAVRIWLLKTSDVQVSLSTVNPASSRFRVQVKNRKSHPVVVQEIGFYFAEQSPHFRRIHADVDGQFRGASVEPKEEEYWTLSCRQLRHHDCAGKGAAYVRLENGKRVRGELIDLEPYRAKPHSAAS